ncbi:hypothetical protein LSH36_457g02068 [Paralvinella palmiformis]|uniref:Cyclin-H n=1 Tax=Paralvinella palmiformis TaxID=53620 RepID=A0AAD9JA23_9ANNE|nr:hypothetical protein LSH36_457g02068 [Paralvinella palmiformis]
MFSTSTQLKYWIFSGTTEINQLRSEINSKFISGQLAQHMGDKKPDSFLTVEEETKIRRHYEYVLKEFCTKFQPPMPRYVLGTAMAYVKRFYLRNSVMDFHPKDVIYTCVYLACKVEEFNISIVQFVSNIKNDAKTATDLILSQELLMMHQLNYHLTVHNPYRPLEGLFIDIKTRCPEISDPESLRPAADEFLDKSLHTDVCMIFAPSQILRSILILIKPYMNGHHRTHYAANKLLATGGKEHLMKTIEHVKRIKYMVKNTEMLDRDEVKQIENKLELCRNQENNPNSEKYRQKQEELLEEEEDRRLKKCSKMAEEELNARRQLIGL